VTYRSEDDVEYEAEEAPRRGRRWISIIVILALAATGSASAFLWRAYGNNFSTFPSFGSTPAADVGDKVIVQKDLQAFQQQITAQTQAATQLLGSQQAEIKRLSEQMTALATKLDTLQRSVTSLQVTAPAPIPIKPAPIPMPPVRKKPVVPKPAEEPAAEAPPSPSPLSR
jgi:flagellar basal body-associated protein FliL